MSRSQVVLLLVLSTPLFSQRTAKPSDPALVSRAKNAIISRFDRALPSITLESFLRYETEDPAIEWRISPCGALSAHTGKSTDDETCVQAYSDLQDDRVVVIVVRVRRETSALPELLSVAILENGLERHLRLIELPAAIYRGKSKSQSPQDLLPLKRVA